MSKIKKNIIDIPYYTKLTWEIKNANFKIRVN